MTVSPARLRDELHRMLDEPHYKNVDVRAGYAEACRSLLDWLDALAAAPAAGEGDTLAERIAEAVTWHESACEEPGQGSGRCSCGFAQRVVDNTKAVTAILRRAAPAAGEGTDACEHGDCPDHYGDPAAWCVKCRNARTSHP